jgi:MarR family transcriptional regulator, organic hydroperoxide resistance regulator
VNVRERQRRAALGNEIAALMGPLVRGLRVTLLACAEELGLSPGEANALWVLAAIGDTTTKDLARRLDIDPANASTMLTKLERRGLVRREPAQHDRRKRVVSLTDQGRETRQRLARCVGERQPSFRALSTDELATFRDMLRRVAAEGGVSPRPGYPRVRPEGQLRRT